MLEVVDGHYDPAAHTLLVKKIDTHTPPLEGNSEPGKLFPPGCICAIGASNTPSPLYEGGSKEQEN